jgi:hypothetical protein
VLSLLVYRFQAAMTGLVGCFCRSPLTTPFVCRGDRI